MLVRSALVFVIFSRYLQFASSHPSGQHVLRIQPRLAFDMTPGPQYAVTLPAPPLLLRKQRSDSDDIDTPTYCGSQGLGYCPDSTNSIPRWANHRSLGVEGPGDCCDSSIGSTCCGSNCCPVGYLCCGSTCVQASARLTCCGGDNACDSGQICCYKSGGAFAGCSTDDCNSITKS